MRTQSRICKITIWPWKRTNRKPWRFARRTRHGVRMELKFNKRLNQRNRNKTDSRVNRLTAPLSPCVQARTQPHKFDTNLTHFEFGCENRTWIPASVVGTNLSFKKQLEVKKPCLQKRFCNVATKNKLAQNMPLATAELLASPDWIRGPTSIRTSCSFS